jgi:hypothetical protein
VWFINHQKKPVGLHQNVKTMNAQPVSLMNTALRFGLFTGLGLVLYVVLLYVLQVNIFAIYFSIVQFVIMYGFIIFMMVKAIRKINALSSSPLMFGQKYLAALTTGIVGMLMYSVTYLLIYYVFDKAYLVELIENMIYNVEEMMMRAGLDGASLEKEMGKLVVRMERVKDIGYATWTTLLSAVVSPGVIGLIVGAAVNTRKHHEKYENAIDMNHESI